MPTGAAMRVTRTRSALRRLIEAEDQIEMAQRDFESLEEGALGTACKEALEVVKELQRGAARALDRAKAEVPMVARES